MPWPMTQSMRPAEPKPQAERQHGREGPDQDSGGTRAPPIRMGSVNERWSTSSKPSRASDQRSATEREERQKERTCSEGDREAEHDLDHFPESTGGAAEGQRYAGHRDDDDGHDLGDRPCTDSRTRSSGASHGMPEPAACAAVTLRSTQAEATPSAPSATR